MIVTVYVDESGTHGSPVTILGGWVGRTGQWAAFDPKWRKFLKRSAVTNFHSKEIRHSKGDFRGWTVFQKQEFVAAAAKLALKNLEFGFAVLLKEEDYQRHYIAGHRPKEIPLDSRYGLCFRYCLGLVGNLAMQSFERTDLDINLVLESGHKNFGDAKRIFGKVKQSSVPHEQEIVRSLSTLSTADKNAFPGLQIADVVAYSAFQHVTRSPVETVAIGHGATDKYVERAKKIQRTPIFHLGLGPLECAQFKKFVLDQIEEKSARRNPGG